MDLRTKFGRDTPAIVLAEGEFGETGGKTANGVVLHSNLFDARVIVDSTTAGQTADEVLERPGSVSIPIVGTMEEAVQQAPESKALIIGVAPAGGALPEEWVSGIKTAIRSGCDVVSGLHVFLGEQEEWQKLAEEDGIQIFDVRKPPVEDELRVGDGRTSDVDAPIVLTMGTDCAIGKRTTTYELYQAACEAGLDAGWVATGQTGIIIGAHAGVAIDRVPADFCAGVVEDLVCSVAEDHDYVFVEGQAAPTHRAYSGVTLSILHGAWPDSVVLVDDPDRERRTHFEQFPVEDPTTACELIDMLSDAEVDAVSTWGDSATVTYQYPVPTENVFETNGAAALLNHVRATIEGPDT
jgi:uncharacterized NAD-dependent epimerase/dehydratase family protein